MHAGFPPSFPVGPSAVRPRLVLVTVAMDSRYGSEPGKAWHWARALARHYELHVLAPAEVVERCRVEPEAADWHWHATPAPAPRRFGLGYYFGYRQWCASVLPALRELQRTLRPVGVHHITLGSFRMLPRYDRAGLPWTLGPIGGGETVPRHYLRTARFPWRVRVAEAARPWGNAAFTVLPWLRPVFQGARLSLATTAETETVLQRLGATATAVVFPDAAQGGPPPDEVRKRRAAQLPDVAHEIRLVWSARALWWKGGQIAIELTRRLLARGVKVRLDLISQGPALPALRERVERAKLGDQCRVRNFVPRRELLQLLLEAHAFVYPTLHDSSSSALLEAYLTGLPSLTVGVGGPCLVVTPATGFNTSAPDLNAWMEGAAERIVEWQKAPAIWQAATEAALARSADFGPEHLARSVDRWLAPESGVYRPAA